MLFERTLARLRTQTPVDTPEVVDVEAEQRLLRDRVSVLGATAVETFQRELDLALLAVENGEPQSTEKLLCLVDDWGYSAAVVEDFGGIEAMRQARADASSTARPLADVLDTLHVAS